MNTHAKKLRSAAARCTRYNSDVALLCEHALTAADRLDTMAVHYDRLRSFVLAAGMLAPHGSGAKAILDEAEQYMVSAAESWQRPNSI